MAQSWDAKTLKEMAERAWNYRSYIGKQEFKALFTFIEVLELAEAAGIDIRSPKKFQNFILKIRSEYEKDGREKADKFRNQHIRPTLKKEALKLSRKDWRHHLGILAGRNDEELYYPVF